MLKSKALQINARLSKSNDKKYDSEYSEEEDSKNSDYDSEGSQYESESDQESISASDEDNWDDNFLEIIMDFLPEKQAIKLKGLLVKYLEENPME